MYSNFKEHFSKLSLNYFDMFLIINLDKDKKRYQETVSQLIECGVNCDKIVRIDAIYERWNGHFGCGQSHVKALEYAITHNLKNVVIVEDDFNITSDVNTVNKLITTFVSNIKDWDVLDLSPFSAKKKDTDIDNISRLEYSTTTTGYAVNNNYYDTLLKNRKESVKLLKEQTHNYVKKCEKEDNCKRIVWSTGIAIDQYQNRLQNKHNWYAFKNNIADQSRGGSTIMSEKFYIKYT